MSEQRELHYIITMMWPYGRNGSSARTESGIIAADPGDTRRQIYNKVCERFMPGSSDVVTLFFSLEPNEIGGAA